MCSSPTGSTAARTWSNLAALRGPVQPPVAAVSAGPQDACAGHEGVVESLRNGSTRGHVIVRDFKCKLLTIYDSFARMAAFKPKQCAASNQCIRTPRSEER